MWPQSFFTISLFLACSLQIPSSDAIRCWSCMSKVMHAEWSNTFIRVFEPASIFSDACNDPINVPYIEAHSRDSQPGQVLVRDGKKECNTNCYTAKFTVKGGKHGGVEVTARGCQSEIQRKMDPAAAQQLQGVQSKCMTVNGLFRRYSLTQVEDAVEICSCNSELCNSGQGSAPTRAPVTRPRPQTQAPWTRPPATRPPPPPTTPAPTPSPTQAPTTTTTTEASTAAPQPETEAEPEPGTEAEPESEGEPSAEESGEDEDGEEEVPAESSSTSSHGFVSRTIAILALLFQIFRHFNLS